MTLIRTKLSRPYLDDSLIQRRHLIERLNGGLDQKLTLISAQAGAGKSTLLAQWLQQLDSPSAWLSLDQHDNDLMLFVTYLCAAIQTAFPDACCETLELIQAPETPPVRIIAATLVNELETLFAAEIVDDGSYPLCPRLVLVVDDYHQITLPAIHTVVTELIAYQPSGLHLVVASRVDPSFPLAKLRAGGQLTELRTRDLRFDVAEAAGLLDQTCNRTLELDEVRILTDRTEGWATGLRLAGLSLRDAANANDFIKRFGGTTSAILVDYLLDEVLGAESPAVESFLLQTSILDRFCAELCDYVMEPGAQTVPPGIATSILQKLAASNLFLVNLDASRSWFRYHHLFRDLLQLRLRRHYDDTHIQALHVRASTWLGERGYFEEAFGHALAGGDVDRAVQLLELQRLSLLNRTRWAEVQRYYQTFQPEDVAQQPALQMINAWLKYHNGHYEQLPRLLQELELTVARHAMSPDAERYMEGEISALRSLVAYFDNDLTKTITEAKKSIARTHPELWIVRILARLCLALAYQMRGEFGRAFATIYEGVDLEQTTDSRFTPTMLVTACNLYWFAADLTGMRHAANQAINLIDQAPAAEIKGYAHYNMGRICYLQNDLAVAETHFAAVVERPHVNYGDCFVDSAYGLALTYLAQERRDEASVVVEDALAYVVDTGNTTLLSEALAMRADIAVRQGQVGPAEQWTEQLPGRNWFTPMVRLLRPSVILARVWLAQGTVETVGQASTRLDGLADYARSTHNNITLIDVLPLQASVKLLEGDSAMALDLLQEALELAEPGNIIRPFLDLDSQLIPLLQLAEEQDIQRQHVQRILDAWEKTASHAATRSAPGSHGNVSSFPNQLTPREMQVLVLLADHLSNKEIADELVISLATVKSHTLNIYAKLDVHGRWQAVARAADLGLLPNA